MHPTAHHLLSWTPRVIAAIALVTMMLQLGFELEPVSDRARKRHKRRLLVRALIFNFVAVPLLALAVARGFGYSGPIATALLLLAASPGGRYAPTLAAMSGSDTELAVEITLFANKLSSFVSPLLAAWMLGSHRAGIRELQFMAELVVLQIVPYYGARAVRKRWPNVAAGLVWPARLAATTAMVILLVYLIAHHALRTTLILGANGWMVVLSFGAVLMVLGWLAGGRDVPTRRAFAITAEARNLALALVIASGTVNDQRLLLSIFAAWTILLAFGLAAALLTRVHAGPAKIPGTPALRGT
jgi:BASS family bile acid:Na+ symporter